MFLRVLLFDRSSDCKQLIKRCVYIAHTAEWNGSQVCAHAHNFTMIEIHQKTYVHMYGFINRYMHIYAFVCTKSFSLEPTQLYASDPCIHLPKPLQTQLTRHLLLDTFKPSVYIGLPADEPLQPISDIGTHSRGSNIEKHSTSGCWDFETELIPILLTR